MHGGHRHAEDRQIFFGRRVNGCKRTFYSFADEGSMAPQEHAPAAKWAFSHTVVGEITLAIDSPGRRCIASVADWGNFRRKCGCLSDLAQKRPPGFHDSDP
jgi:hypothetical protein